MPLVDFVGNRCIATLSISASLSLSVYLFVCVQCILFVIRPFFYLLRFVET